MPATASSGIVLVLRLIGADAMKTTSPCFTGALVCSLYVWAATSNIQAADAAKQHASNPAIFAISDSPIDPDLNPTVSLAQLPATGSQPSAPSGTNPTQTPRTSPATPAPGGRAQPTPPPQPNANANALALGSAANPSGLSSLASSSYYGLGSTPNMIGDTLGFQYFIRIETPDGKGGAVSLATGDQSEKISDDTSPIPTDRVFFDYNFFSNALLTANGTDIGLNRYTFGLEKTFFDGQCSVEVKAPLDGGLNSIQSPNNTTDANEGTIFGTLAITPKMLLYQDQQRALAAGMAIGLPTSPDFVVQNQVRVRDEAVHLAPFVGLLLAPDDAWFSITYLQLDFAADGDTVIQSGDNLGKLHYPTLMYVDTSLGYWLFHSGSYDAQRGWITGVAPMIELHYTTTLQNAEGIGPVFPLSLRADSLNMTGGLYFQIGPLSSLLVGGIAPLRTDSGDKEFDAEVVVEFNRRF
jgi:hypothetical protein